MRQLPILTFFFCLAFITKAQVVEYRVDKYVEANLIDTFLVYSFPCSGQGVWFDSCKPEEPHYLIWKQKGFYYLKKFEYCKNYKTIQLDSNNLISFYLLNKKDIDREKIRQPTYFEYKKKGKKIDTLQITSMIDHSCSHKFKLPLTINPKYKYANTYDLDFKFFENGRKNTYYSYNQKTKFKSLIDKATILIKEIDARNGFEPE